MIKYVIQKKTPLLITEQIYNVQLKMNMRSVYA